MISTDLETTNTVEQNLEEVNFPSVEEIIGKEPAHPVFEIGFRADILGRALSIAQKLGGPLATVHFKFTHKLEAAYLRFTMESGKVLIVVMSAAIPED